MYQRKVDVDMLKAVKSVTSKDEGLTLETSANTLFVAFTISTSTLHGYIVVTSTDLDGCTTQVSISHWTTLTNVYILLFGLKMCTKHHFLHLPAVTRSGYRCSITINPFNPKLTMQILPIIQEENDWVM